MREDYQEESAEKSRNRSSILKYVRAQKLTRIHNNCPIYTKNKPE